MSCASVFVMALELCSEQPDVVSPVVLDAVLIICVSLTQLVREYVEETGVEGWLKCQNSVCS